MGLVTGIKLGVMASFWMGFMIGRIFYRSPTSTIILWPDIIGSDRKYQGFLETVPEP